MQISLSAQELKNLVEMSTLATSIASVDAEEIDHVFSSWKDLHQKILALALQDRQLAGLLENDHETGELVLKKDYLEKSYSSEKINDYSEHVFWSDLITRLADKALEEHLGTEQFESLSEDERRTMAEPLEKSLWQECSTHGIDRLGFILPPSDA